jgi:hypothetical protein
LNVVDNAPVALVATSADNEIAVQLTDTDALTGAGSATVGCLASELHSRTLPGEEGVKPLPVMVTEAPPVKPVLGVTVMGTLGLPAAKAPTEPATIASPETKLAAAPKASRLGALPRERRRSVLMLTPATLTARTDKKSPPRNRRAASTRLRSPNREGPWPPWICLLSRIFERSVRAHPHY